MDDKLKHLKQAMKNHTFKQVQFTEQHHMNVIKAMHQKEITADMILPLLTDARTGYELVQLLHVKGTETIELNEGSIYTLLHQLEQQGLILAEWAQDGYKYYSLTKKGKKLVQKQEKNEMNRYALKDLLQEVRCL